MHQNPWIMCELCANYVTCAIFLSKNFSCFNLLSLQIFGFNFNAKLSIFKGKNTGKLLCCLINPSRVFSSFPSCDWLYFFHSQWLLYKKTRAQLPMASSIERLGCLVDLRHLWTLFVSKRRLFAVKIYYIYGKKISMHLSRYEKKNINRFVKICKNYYVPLCIFSRIVQIMHSEPNYCMQFRIHV